jgi:aspartate 1-decarboxylase
LKSKIHRAIVTQADLLRRHGAAAYLVHPGDLVIMIAYGRFEDADARTYVPRMVHVDADNRVIEVGHDPAEVVEGMVGELVSGR